MSQSYRPPDSDLFRVLWQNQKGLCALCGKPMPQHRFETLHASLWRKWRPSFDHIRPRACGGRDDPANLQLAHAHCNRRKGRRMDHRVDRSARTG